MSIKLKLARLTCWWFGCQSSMARYRFSDAYPCWRCDNPDVSYEHLAGMTRHNTFKEWLHFWLFRKWIPKPCRDCHKRYGNHSECTPF